MVPILASPKHFTMQKNLPNHTVEPKAIYPIMKKIIARAQKVCKLFNHIILMTKPALDINK
jgi:hypothetical protein